MDVHVASKVSTKGRIYACKGCILCHLLLIAMDVQVALFDIYLRKQWMYRLHRLLSTLDSDGVQ